MIIVLPKLSKMETQKWICVYELLFFFILAGYARDWEAKTIPEGPVFPEGELVTYIQKFKASPYDNQVRFSYIKFNNSGLFSTCIHDPECMHPHHLFDVPLLKENGKKAVNIVLNDLADQYFDINVELRDSFHTVSLKINLTCKAARGLYTEVIMKSTLQHTPKKIDLGHYEFITMKINNFKVDKRNESVKVGDTILATCEVEQCSSHMLNRQPDGFGKFYVVHEGDRSGDFIHSVGDVIESPNAEVSHNFFEESTDFIAHCSEMVLSCRGSLDEKSAAPSKSIIIDNVDKRFCRSTAVEFFLSRPDGSRTNNFSDIKEHESWRVVCNAVVENSLDQPRLIGPQITKLKLNTIEIPLNKKYMAVASVDFVLKDCATYGEDVKCELREDAVYKIPILPKVCSTQILSITAEIYNLDSMKRKNCSSHVELKSNEELIISCRILVPEMVGLRRINITNAKSQSLHVKTSLEVDSLKRYLLLLVATVPHDAFETNEIHKYTCIVDHAWAESEISLHSRPFVILKKTVIWHKTGLLFVGVFLIVMIVCGLLDCFTTRLVCKAHNVYHRTFCSHYNFSPREPFMKMDDDEETVFERATVCTHLLKES